jgi:3D (Asp-Asp-Asp) domain-containing protein
MLKRFRLLLALTALAFLFGLLLPPSDAHAYYIQAGEEHDVSRNSYTEDYSGRAYENDSGTPPTADPAPEPPAALPDQVAEPEALTYIVNPGDTLYKIAHGFGLSVAAIQSYNDIKNPNTLQVGQKLGIPAVPVDVPLMEGKEPVIQKVLSSTLTAYTAGLESTGKTASHPAYGITFSGVKAEEGRTVAVDPSVIPLGSTVYIEGIGLRRAEDTGSAIKGAKIDVFMDDLNQAQVFGVKKNVKVFVLSAV